MGSRTSITPLKTILENLKSFIKNLQDELDQLENRQAKGEQFHANIRWELQDEKYCFFQSTSKKECTKSKYSSNLKGKKMQKNCIYKKMYATKNYETLYT